MITKSTLNYLLKRNPHNSNWGDMRLYLEAQYCLSVCFRHRTLHRCAAIQVATLHSIDSKQRCETKGE
ncbi:unnamed protein product [Trichobilharzia regenti]|nr:unnamed protein product [Trichobilharzia regenti]